MKKIIIALDGEHFPQGAFNFATHINRMQDMLLAGVFLNPVDYSRLMAYAASAEGGIVVPEWMMKSEDEELVNKNIVRFEEACNKEGIHYRVHKDTSTAALSSLLEETRFADALLISSELFYQNIGRAQPNFYLEEVLKTSECPVMLIPEKFETPAQTILCYDGSESAVFAMKQFAAVFPELCQLETFALSANDGDADEVLPEYSMVTEWLGCHFTNLQVQNVPMVKKDFFTQWLSYQPLSYVVMGGYSRSAFSTFFRKSISADVVKKIKFPIFISHK